MLRTLWIALARAGLLAWLVRVWADSATPEAGEALPLRWLRVAAGHPSRTALALFLLERALRGGRRRPSEPPKPPASARGGPGSELG